MPLNLRALTSVLAGMSASVACNLGPQSCPAMAAPAIMLDVRDSITDSRAGRSALVTAQDGAFADTAEATNVSEGPFGLAHGRPGTYTVTVAKDGYRPWSRSGIKASPGECTVQTVSLTARLQP